jgi:hypothetical protein
MKAFVQKSFDLTHPAETLNAKTASAIHPPRNDITLNMNPIICLCV